MSAQHPKARRQRPFASSVLLIALFINLYRMRRRALRLTPVLAVLAVAGCSNATTLAASTGVAYVATGYAGTVVPVDLGTSTVGKPMTVLRGGGLTGLINGIAITPNGKTAYVSGDGTLIPIDLATRTIGKPIKVPGGGGGAIAIAPDGATAYVAIGGGSYNASTGVYASTNIVPIDLVTGRAGKSIVVPGAGAGHHRDHSGRKDRLCD